MRKERQIKAVYEIKEKLTQDLHPRTSLDFRNIQVKTHLSFKISLWFFLWEMVLWLPKSYSNDTMIQFPGLFDILIF